MLAGNNGMPACTRSPDSSAKPGLLKDLQLIEERVFLDDIDVVLIKPGERLTSFGSWMEHPANIALSVELPSSIFGLYAFAFRRHSLRFSVSSLPCL